jgi:transcriptional regulator with XRE-family HTH domain
LVVVVSREILIDFMKDHAMPDLGLTIKTLREARQFSVGQVAKLADLNAGFVSQLESNQRNASAGTLAKLAHALEVPHRLLLFVAGLLPHREIDAKSAELARTLNHLEKLEHALRSKLTEL